MLPKVLRWLQMNYKNGTCEMLKQEMCIFIINMVDKVIINYLSLSFRIISASAY